MFSNTIRRAIERVNHALDNDPIITAYDLGYLHALHASLQDLSIEGLYKIGDRDILDLVNDIQAVIDRGLLITA